MGNSSKKNSQKHIDQTNFDMFSKAVLGGGCFWCTEAIFQRLKGVKKVQSGYAGGKTINPSYNQICTGSTGHAEVIRIFYDPNTIAYRTLLYIFLHIHDPTTLNKQMYDKGTQYRSTIMYETENQKDIAHQVIQQVMKEGKYPGAPGGIVTQVAKLKTFYPAQQYHQNYYNENPSEGYCKSMIKPKLSKFKTLFQMYLDKSKI